MTRASTDLDDLIAARLAGDAVSLPPAAEDDLRQAFLGHQALQDLFAETGGGGETLADDRSPPVLPSDYEIEREIGRGGMGVVYLVHQQSLRRRVALKVLRPGELRYGPLVQRFLDEARHLARLRHPHIVSIHEVGDAAGEPYFTMDFIDGESLAARLQHGPLPPSQALEVLKPMAAAVQHAHRHGIIHRDLKPSNVLLDAAGQVFVTDFGLARDVSQASSLTLSGELLGTPQYMAPEQARGESALIGEATDIHALGMILYEMLTGRTPYGTASAAETLVRLLRQEPLPPRRLDHRIPRDLETICLKMLEKDPARRYANVSALLEDLRRYEAGEPLLARRPSLLTQARRWCTRHWRTLATVLVTASVVLAAAPLLFDKSYDDLVAWGDEELAGGRSETAVRVYLRALRKAPDSQRPVLLDRLVRGIRQLDDPQAAAAAGLTVIEHDPAADFGRYNYLVAQAAATRLRAASPTGAIDVWQTQPPEALRLLRLRLEQALRGPLSNSEQEEANRTLEAVNLALAADQTWARTTATMLAELPTGDASTLRAIAADSSAPVWTRAKAALVLAQRAEAARDSAAALEGYRQALDLFRRVYPTLGGVKAATGANPSRVTAPDAEECELLRRTVAAVRRLDPQSFPEPRGGLEFETIGWQWPDSVGLDLALELCDPSIENPDAGLPHHLPRLVPLRFDAPVRVSVLDGTYRLRLRGHHARWDAAAERTVRLLQLEPDDWPETVTIAGGMLRLPPLHLRLAREIELLQPATGAAVDLRTLELSWTPIPGAVRYQVQLLYTTETPHPATVYFETVSTDAPRLSFAELSDRHRRQVREHLPPGRTGGWRVDAYDADGRCLGKSLDEFRFLAARGFDGTP